MTLTPVSETPQFTHDCNCCNFLGRHTSEQGPVDLYVHANGHYPTVIARFSSEGSQYSSGLAFSYGRSSELTEARLRAQAKGYLEFNVYDAAYHRDPDCAEVQKELMAAIPFTPEYQAVLAYETGNLERSEGLLTHLISVALAKLRKYRPEASQFVAIRDATERIALLLTVYRGCGTLEAYDLLSPMMAFAWADQGITPAKQLMAEAAA